IARIDALARSLGFKQYEAGDFLLKYPLIFKIYRHPVQQILFFPLTRKAILQIEEEKFALNTQIGDAVTCLRKLLRLSNTGRVLLEHVRIVRVKFGLSDDFEYSVILKHPQYFWLFDAEETRNKYIEIAELEYEHDPKVLKDPNLIVCAIERLREREYRERRVEAENIRKCLEKRGVAMIHKLLSITVEKKLALERITHFRMATDLPKELKEFFLQHQGVFYISTRGNRGKLHTVFLRDAYWRGDLVEPNELYFARRKLAELIKMSSGKYSGCHEIEFVVQDKLPIDEKRGNESHSDSSVNSGSDGEGDEDSDSELDLGFGSGSTCNNSVSEEYICA
ncbi:hypothetical protein GIB67_017657, partial [Kingdonia uniflora]